MLALLAAGAWLFWPTIADLVDRVRLPAVRTVLVTRVDPAAGAALRGKAANGYVVAARRAALSADAPGRIVEMNVREGSVVRKGDVVARLYSDEQAAAERQAVAECRAAEEGARRAAADLETARADLVRLRKQSEASKAAVDSAAARLVQRKAEVARVRDLAGKGVSTQSELDDAQAAFDVATADVVSARAAQEAAEAGVATGVAREAVAQVEVGIAAARAEAAGAALDMARAALEKTNVRAPFDGIVVLKDAEVGEVVSPFSQGGSNARGSVVTMVDFASLEVQANVPQTSLDAVLAGAPATIFLDAWPDHPYEGRVDRIWPTADRQKGTIEVRVVFLAPDDRLRPDLGVRVVFRPADAAPEAPPAAAAPAILVPEDALVRAEGGYAVFVLSRDTVRLRSVVVGEAKDGRVALREGLADGETIVVAPPPTLADGARVRVAENGR